MEHMIGAAVGLGVGLLTSAVRMDRDRALYPVALIVIASYYVLFAVMGGGDALVAEIGIAAVFLVAAIIGFRINLWIVAVAVVGHGVQDIFHGGLVKNTGVPDWWPMFCAAADLIIGAYLALLLLIGRIEATYPQARKGGTSDGKRTEGSGPNYG